MNKWICVICGFIYDEALGMPEHGIAAGTRFDDLPDDWTCPECGSPKSAFERWSAPEIEDAPLAQA
ncbi:MAG: rubredoxin [Nevskia sp.]|nr:rubredoxin [Nevskia sp.]